jgi:ubiquinone/menaquinone biosynthesis methyltransferase
MAQMQKDLRLSVEPRHIECFDNSNIQGTNPVSACVVFKDGKPSKKDYRHFNIKTVEGPNDFASMEEVVYRRYKRLLDENQPLPQLIIIDGGKGQLSSALKSIDDLGLRGEIAIIGIAKRLEELFYPGDSVPLYLDKKSETLKIIQQLRNEAHRFGITHHRDKRSKSALNSTIELIPGIGEKTMTTLIQHFKSVKRLKLATEIEISDINEEMLKFGEARAIDQNYFADLKFTPANGEKLPFADNSFDFYTIAFGIRNFTNIDKGLSEAFRVLKPGGKFICLEFSQVNSLILSKIYDLYSFNVIPKIGKLVANDEDSYQYLVESIRKFPNQEKFKKMIIEAEFENVNYQNLSFGTVAIHTGIKKI